MADSRRSLLGNQFDIEQILLDAQSRWLRPAEICEILRNYRNFRIALEPPTKPPSGSLFLFDRKVLRYFRKDGHNWRKKKDGKTVKEAHERLKAGSIDVLHCYYAHGEENEMFQRRTYWMLEEEYMHIVLVHYREVKGNKAIFGRTRDTEEVVPSSLSSSPVSSSCVGSYNQVPSQTTDTTSMNSAQASEYEDVESDNYQASSRYHSFLESQRPEDRPAMSLMDSGLLSSYLLSYPNGYQGSQPENPILNFVSFDQEIRDRGSNDTGFGLNFEPRKQLDLTSWENVLEGLPGEPFVPSFPSATQPATMGVIPKQENMIFGQCLTDELNIKQEMVHRPRGQEKWQVTSDDSSDILKWPMDQKLHNNLNYDMSTRFHEQKAYSMDLLNASAPFWTHPEHQNGHLAHNDLPLQLSDAELGSLLKSNLADNLSVGDNANHSSTAKQPLLDDNCRTDELKKVDSFTRWMSKELGEVDESHKQSSSAVYWDEVESENAVADSSLSPQVHLDSYLLSPSLSQDQLFSIIDFSPNWAYAGSETKVLISGKFLKSRQDAAEYKWSCMFGEVEVPVEVLADGVLRCHSPPHRDGRVPFYVTCSNRLACSEVREFEFRVSHPRDSDMTDLHRGSTDDMLLHIRLGKLLSLGSHQMSLSSSVGEKPSISCKISSLMEEGEDEWLQMVQLISGEFSPGKVKEQLLQKILKEKLHDWLLHKANEDGKGPSVLDEEGQGVIHLSAALGYDWAIAPTIAAGVNINFRDVNGWTALHWAAFRGRERTVVALVSMAAAPGALTDPTPEFPSGRTPADLASGNGHKGIAGYLAESSLTTHLSSLTLKDTEDSDVPESSSVTAIQTASQRVATPLCDGEVSDVSLKDSLTAVRNAAQAAARIHQVFRVQSFQKKQLVEYGDDKFGMSDERALSLVSLKTKKHGLHDEPVHTAAIRIQNKFRGWKGRKEFLIIRQRIVKIQFFNSNKFNGEKAHVRGHQVRKHFRKIVWSVGIVEKAILRWRRKGCGLRGFRPEALIEGSTTRTEPSKEDDYDFLKEGRKQTEERLQKALARVKSMVQYPEARDQYRRLLTVVTEFQEKKVVNDSVLNSSEEAGYYGDDMIDIEALLGDDTFMTTEC